MRTTKEKQTTTIRIPPPHTWIISFDNTGTRGNRQFGVTVSRAGEWATRCLEIREGVWEDRLIPRHYATTITLNYPFGRTSYQYVCDIENWGPVLEYHRWSLLNIDDSEWFEKFSILKKPPCYIMGGAHHLPFGLYERHKHIFKGTPYFDQYKI